MMKTMKMKRQVTYLKASIYLLRQWGEILVTRKLGESIRQSIASELQNSKEVEGLLFDFSGLQIMDYSCADELVARFAVELNKNSVSRLASGGLLSSFLRGSISRM